MNGSKGGQWEGAIKTDLTPMSPKILSEELVLESW